MTGGKAMQATCFTHVWWHQIQTERKHDEAYASERAERKTDKIDAGKPQKADQERWQVMSKILTR